MSCLALDPSSRGSQQPAKPEPELDLVWKRDGLAGELPCRWYALSSGIARSKFKHPWFAIPAGSNSGFAGLDPAMKHLMETKLNDWPHPVLAWTVMLLGDGDDQRILKSRKL
jgi:hypothetical protein